MAIVSYAQNYEDVMLLRAFRNVQQGFYIDVGAQHPIHDSVTKAFYEKGWWGINIEPVAQWFALVVEDRPDDINLQIAISETGKELDLYEVVDTGLSTISKRYADAHEAEGRTVVRHTVPCRSLDDIIAEYVNDEIHFLKIDVEGAEATVLRSISLDRHRPWIMVIEATEPNSQRPAYADWEPRLFESGYDLVYEDGLNRFYLAKERVELKDAFRLPPNYFDSFIPYGQWYAQQELDLRTRELSDARALADAVRHGTTLGELRQRLLHERALHRLMTRRLRDLQSERDHLDERNQQSTFALVAAKNEIELMTEKLHSLQSERDHLDERNRQSTLTLADVRDEIERLRASDLARVQAESELAFIRRSHSWRLTSPLRAIRRVLAHASMGSRSFVRTSAGRMARALVGLPGARPLARRLLSYFPDLKRRLVVLMHSAPDLQSRKPSPLASVAAPDASAGLSRSANEALDLLKQHRKSDDKAR